jgi:hypothetical protein
VKSGEHAAVGSLVSIAAGAALFEGVPLLVFLAAVGYGVALSVLVDLDHFLITRALVGDWRHLRLAVTNPRVGLVDQERIFADVDGDIRTERLLSHHLVGGVLVGGLTVAGAADLAVFSAVVLYAHVLGDYLRDLKYA